jgi:DNA-binding MarR family transcriptional regulator
MAIKLLTATKFCHICFRQLNGGAVVASEDSCRELLARLGELKAVIRTVKRDMPRGGPRAGFVVLLALRRHGELRSGELCGLLDVAPSVVSRHVAELEEHGWIERLPNTGDGRSWYLRVTPAGEQAIEESLAQAGRHLTAILHDWSDEEIAELSGLLTRLHTSFAAQRASTVPHSRTFSGAKGV